MESLALQIDLYSLNLLTRPYKYICRDTLPVTTNRFLAEVGATTSETKKGNTINSDATSHVTNLRLVMGLYKNVTKYICLTLVRTYWRRLTALLMMCH